MVLQGKSQQKTERGCKIYMDSLVDDIVITGANFDDRGNPGENFDHRGSPGPNGIFLPHRGCPGVKKSPPGLPRWDFGVHRGTETGGK